MGRRKENKIYTMFDYNKETNKSKCLMEGCDHYIKGNHGANLLRHFFSQHRVKYDEIQKMNLENKENLPEKPSRNVMSVLQCCTNLVTVHGRSFSIVEDEAFKELLKLPAVNQNELQSINVKNVKTNIQEKAYEVRLQISKELKSCLLALKVDVASVKLRRFLGLNVQYVSAGRIVLRNLSVVELHDRNTGDYLKENIAISLSRFGIDLKQILTITTDNGTNMLRMVNQIDESVNESLDDSTIASTDESIQVDNEETIQNLQLQVEVDNIVVRKVASIRCAAHCLQLAVKDACQDSQDFLERCRHIVRMLRTPNMSLRLKQQGLPQAVIDMPVRWDSTANMLASVQKLRSFCIDHFDVPENTWTTLDKYLEILQPCRCLSKTLQKEQLTFGDFYIAWMRCRHQVAQIDDPFARRLESCMIDRQANLFENGHFVAAVYLDPRINSILSAEQATSARILLTDIYKRIVQLNERTSDPSDLVSVAGTSRQGSSNMSNFDDYLRQQFVNVNNRQETSNVYSLEREINFKLVEFLQEPILSADQNILHYWKKKKITDPYLYNLAKVVLATPPTSVSVERLFSSLKVVLNNLRMCLNDSIIEDIMIVRNNHLYT